MWIFGYGSLLWYTNFPYIQSVPGFVRGYVRRFWQASPDHRGTPEKPGRTVTLVPQETGEVWGIAYRIADEIVDDVLKYLYWREKAGYECKTVQFYPRSDVKMDPFPLQLFMSRGEGTEYFVTGESEDEIARRVCLIVSSSGPSGTNIEYVLRLAKRLHEIGPESNDEHVERIAKLVLSLCQELKIKDPDLTDYIKDALTKG
ncbi:unnamed protein product [Soboliphyme baturini]|uniref:glutathione-specific gamma-glutamylcyclotransferase n=1 Tax=Soboliphyme baturini TaxID=241478 RepID=A0A183ICW6_9BILA|nr:unnamed protein product [Soboliphyme baturini]